MNEATANLIDKLRKSRQSDIEIGEHRFTYRRPTDVEAASMKQESPFDVATRFVVGWAGVKEIDIIPGGSPVAVEFSPELWIEWCADHPEFWSPIAFAVLDSYRAYRGIVEDVSKN